MPHSPTTADPFNAVAEPRRRQILDQLARGERPAGDVVAALRLARPQVSRHLGVLRKVGLVTVRGAGRLRPIHDWVKSFEPFWGESLDRPDDDLGEQQMGNARGRKT